MGESRQRWQAQLWIGPKIDEPVTVFGETLSGLDRSVRQWLEEHQPIRLSTASPSHQGLRRTSYLLVDESRGDMAPGWQRLNDRIGPLRLSHFEKVVGHFLDHMLVAHGPDYQSRAESRQIPLAEIRALRRTVCQNEKDWLQVEDWLQDGWCILNGRLLGWDERAFQTKARMLLLGHHSTEPDQFAFHSAN